MFSPHDNSILYFIVWRTINDVNHWCWMSFTWTTKEKKSELTWQWSNTKLIFNQTKLYIALQIITENKTEEINIKIIEQKIATLNWQYNWNGQREIQFIWIYRKRIGKTRSKKDTSLIEQRGKEGCTWIWPKLIVFFGETS